MLEEYVRKPFTRKKTYEKQLSPAALAESFLLVSLPLIFHTLFEGVLAEILTFSDT